MHARSQCTQNAISWLNEETYAEKNRLRSSVTFVRTWLQPVCVCALLAVGCTTGSVPGRDDEPAPIAASAAPRFSQGGPYAEEYGASQGYPIGDRLTCSSPTFRIGCYSHFDQIYEGRLVRRATVPSLLARAASEPAIRYEYQGQIFTIDDYLGRNPTTGLLIAQGEKILIERYQYARNDRHRFPSWSMAKTVTAMLIGIAIEEGFIRSIDDHAAAYVFGLRGTEYGRTSLRHLLQMSSGVRFIEDNSGKDDVARLSDATYRQLGSGGIEAVTPFNVRIAPAGTKFYYASAETQVLGLVLRSAVGRPIAVYLQEKIWDPIGAEADASWLIDRAGQEAAYCCINAVLRDYARLGLLLAHDGQWRGQQIIPAAWVQDATRIAPDQPHLHPGSRTTLRSYGYGYQVYIFGGERRMFVLLGIRGQAIFVDPGSRLVLVHTAARKQQRDPGHAEAVALWLSLVKQLGH